MAVNPTNPISPTQPPTHHPKISVCPKTQGMAHSRMTVTLEIPDELTSDLKLKFGNLGSAALEALAAEAYEKDALSLEQVRRLLDLPSRWEAQAVLQRHGVWPGQTVEDVVADLDALESLRSRAS